MKSISLFSSLLLLSPLVAFASKDLSFVCYDHLNETVMIEGTVRTDAKDFAKGTLRINVFAEEIKVSGIVTNENISLESRSNSRTKSLVLILNDRPESQLSFISNYPAGTINTLTLDNLKCINRPQ